MNAMLNKFPIRLLYALAVLTPALVQANEVNLYSARQEALIKPLLDNFTARTGIRVNLVSAKADALMQRLISEGRHTPADVLLTVDAGNLGAAKTAGLLQPLRSDTVHKAVPEAWRDKDGQWTGLSLRPPLFYARAPRHARTTVPPMPR